jgi:transcriptional activator of cad operon
MIGESALPNASSVAEPSVLHFGPWSACRDTGELHSAETVLHLEPKVMALLWVLASQVNRVFTREALMQQLWPGVIVGEDTLARTVFKLRKALGDDAKTPKYVDTLPKRGYRFIHPLTLSTSTGNANVVPRQNNVELLPANRQWRISQIAAGLATIFLIALLGWRFSTDSKLSSQQSVSAPIRNANALAGDANMALMIQRGNDYYAQYSRVDNQAAIELFERVIAMQPEHALAHAGLANALIQTVIRWHDGPERDQQAYSRVRDALQRGLTKTPQAQTLIDRASRMAERAVELAPDSAASHKAVGLVLSTEGDFPAALAAYKRSMTLDPDAWGAMINTADLLDANQQDREALRYLEMAFAAMTRSYATQSAQIQPWYAQIARLIGDRHQKLQQLDQAERWYRTTLQIAPFEPEASGKLAALLRQTGREPEAIELCARLIRRINNTVGCDRQN